VLSVPVCLLSRMKQRFASGRRGQALVEYALVVPLIFLLVFGLIDFGRLFFTELTLQYALRAAARYAVTGNHLPDTTNPSQTLSRLASIQQVAQQHAMGISVAGLQISSTVGGATGPGAAGGPGDSIRLSLTYNLPLMTPIIGQFFRNGVYTFTVSTAFKNEPFLASAQE